MFWLTHAVMYCHGRSFSDKSKQQHNKHENKNKHPKQQLHANARRPRLFTAASPRHPRHLVAGLHARPCPNRVAPVILLRGLSASLLFLGLFVGCAGSRGKDPGTKKRKKRMSPKPVAFGPKREGVRPAPGGRRRVNIYTFRPKNSTT